jgi:hypothetical protein
VDRRVVVVNPGLEQGEKRKEQKKTKGRAVEQKNHRRKVSVYLYLLIVALLIRNTDFSVAEIKRNSGYSWEMHMASQPTRQAERS